MARRRRLTTSSSPSSSAFVAAATTLAVALVVVTSSSLLPTASATCAEYCSNFTSFCTSTYAFSSLEECTSWCADDVDETALACREAYSSRLANDSVADAPLCAFMAPGDVGNACPRVDKPKCSAIDAGIGARCGARLLGCAGKLLLSPTKLNAEGVCGCLDAFIECIPQCIDPFSLVSRYDKFNCRDAIGRIDVPIGCEWTYDPTSPLACESNFSAVTGLDVNTSAGKLVFSAGENASFDEADGLPVGDGLRLAAGPNGLELVTVADTEITKDGVNMGDARIRASAVVGRDGKIATSMKGFASLNTSLGTMTFLDGIMVGEFSSGEQTIFGGIGCKMITRANSNIVSYSCDYTNTMLPFNVSLSFGGTSGEGTSLVEWDGSIVAELGDYDTNVIEIVTIDGLLLNLSYEDGVVADASITNITTSERQAAGYVFKVLCETPKQHACYDAVRTAVAAAGEETSTTKRAVSPYFDILALGGNFVLLNTTSAGEALSSEDRADVIDDILKDVKDSNFVHDVGFVSDVPTCVGSDCLAYVLSGGVTSTSAVVAVKIITGTAMRVVASSTNFDNLNDIDQSPDAVNRTRAVSPIVTRSRETAGLHKFTLTGLLPDTEYEYRVEVDGTLFSEADVVGKFRTMPIEGTPTTFTFFASSNCESNSDSLAFTALTSAMTDVSGYPKARFFAHLGSMYYAQVTTVDPSVYRSNWNSVFSSAVQKPLYQAAPLVYVWDDHDYGQNDGNRWTLKGRDSARRIFREAIPSYDLVAEDEFGAIFHAFTVGRVRFLVTDLRSEADPSNSTIMGFEQKTWFKEELAAADNATDIKLVIWFNPVVWVGEETSKAKRTSALAQNKLTVVPLVDGDWRDYPEERTEIGDVIAAMSTKVFIIGGDMDGAAFDDGSLGNYGHSVVRGAPSLLIGPLDQRPDTKGGPYSHGCVRNDGQFARIVVKDEKEDEDPCVFLDVFKTEFGLFGGLGSPSYSSAGLSYDTCQQRPPPGGECSTLPFFSPLETVGIVAGSIFLLICCPCLSCCCFEAGGSFVKGAIACATCGLCCSEDGCCCCPNKDGKEGVSLREV